MGFSFFNPAANNLLKKKIKGDFIFKLFTGLHKTFISGESQEIQTQHEAQFVNKIYLLTLKREIKTKTIYIFGTDITERKLAEEELAKHREHLEELVKERTTELENKNAELRRFNKLFAGREFRIKELRDKVKELEKKSD